MLTKKEAARMIDISAVRTHHAQKDVRELADYGRKYNFINLHVLPVWVPMLRDLLQDAPEVLVGSPVGFPDGGHKSATKVVEAVQLLQDGVQEMDIMMNVGKFKSGDYDYVLQDLRAVLSVVDGKVPTKVIIEINQLTDEEMLHACDLVMQSGADFVKTGTGWIPGGANLDRLQKIKEHCGSRIKIKAAGGIRTSEEFLALVNMGVERMGINTESAIQIIRALP